MKNGVRPSPNANCITQDDGLQIFATHEPLYTDNDAPEMAQLIELISNPSILHDKCLYYISGYIARKLKAHIQCTECLCAITLRARDEAHDHPHGQLTLRKDRGGLLASNDVFSIIKEADTTLRRLIISEPIKTLSVTSVLKVQVKVCEQLRENIFLDLNSHNAKTFRPFEDDHITQIIKFSCKLFTQLVLRHNTRVATSRFVQKNKNTLRHTLTKAIIFRHE